jgi:hypothetical protein
MDSIRTNSQKYDVPTAITFLVAGLGLGSLLTLLFASRFDEALRAGAAAAGAPQETRRTA